MNRLNKEKAVTVEKNVRRNSDGLYKYPHASASRVISKMGVKPSIPRPIALVVFLVKWVSNPPTPQHDFSNDLCLKYKQVESDVICH